jgi:hypothetical protein
MQSQSNIIDIKSKERKAFADLIARIIFNNLTKKDNGTVSAPK